jgi:hypothetical protein
VDFQPPITQNIAEAGGQKTSKEGQFFNTDFYCIF